ncbi:uncharacterized protein LOC124270557, partial [Haliotis rubra]|uniref:uncharacterized protein LOC124270557 n=1 Tax=Haliotis rubra TaxID=36100 RepID=UPI001EE583AD
MKGTSLEVTDREVGKLLKQLLSKCRPRRDHVTKVSTFTMQYNPVFSFNASVQERSKMLLLVALLFLSSVNVLEGRCCAPRQWEGWGVRLGGQMAGATHERPELIKAKINLHYDADVPIVVAVANTSVGTRETSADSHTGLQT